jgi:rSAM/selenodomain-associated transferase 1
VSRDAWLIVFVKAPIPGAVKTRLLPALSAEEACRLYQCLARDTLEAVKRLRAVRIALAYAGNRRFPDCSWLSREAPMFRQRGDELGKRLIQAFRWAFQRKARRVVVVGSDAPDLSSSWIRLAFQHLRRCDVVVGPTSDGGYQLIGLAQPHPELFVGMPWSSDRLLRQTLDRSRRLRLTVRCLEPISDLDTPQDLRRYVEQGGWRRRRSRTARYVARLFSRTCWIAWRASSRKRLAPVWR